MKHRFYVPPDSPRRDQVRFSPEQARQLRSVLRLRPGDCVRVFDGVEPVDRIVELGRVTSEGAEGQVVDERPHPPEPRTRLVAHPALLQRVKFEPVLQKLTEIGVAAVVPVLTARSLVRQPPDEHREARWRAILREAAEQSGRGIVPELRPTLPLAIALRQAVAAGSVLVAYEGEQQLSLREALAGIESPAHVSIFVGPEGGYAPEETALAREAGAQLVTLGPRVLRTETASPVMGALVLYELEAR